MLVLVVVLFLELFWEILFGSIVVLIYYVRVGSLRVGSAGVSTGPGSVSMLLSSFCFVSHTGSAVGSVVTAGHGAGASTVRVSCWVYAFLFLLSAWCWLR